MRRWAWPTMGSVASLAVPGPAGTSTDLDAAQQQVRGWFDEVEAALSPYRPDSDLGRWRRGELVLDDTPLLAEVVDACEQLARFTQGGFHPWDRAGRFDPTGYVKGWAIERGTQVLLAAGIPDACLGVGGDLQLVGNRGTRPWRVAVVDPTDDRRVVAVVESRGARLAVATSGSAQRGEHIWPAALGPALRPALSATRSGAEIRSVTVVGPDVRLADAFATAVWARALQEPLEIAWGWLVGTGYEAIAVHSGGRTASTAGMASHVVTSAAA